MAHIPYGYKIVYGKAVVDEEQANKIRLFFEGYISGLALKVAAEKQEKPKLMVHFTMPRDRKSVV